MKKFYEDNRLFMIYGNHDDRKKNEKYVRRNYAYFYNECKNCREPLEMIGLKPPAGPIESHRKAQKGEKRFLGFAERKEFLTSLPDGQ